MANPTTNLGMTKPTVGGSTDTWGTTLNEDVVDVIDALFSISGTDVTMSDIKFNSMSVQETGAGTDTVKIQAPAAVTTSYTLTMPAAVGSTNQVLSAADGSGTLAWTTPEVGDITSVADATNGGMTVTNGGGPAVTLAVNLNDLSAAAVNVATDSIAILDADDSGTKKESIADLATAMGGTGLSGASGTLAVDASQTQITSVGALGAGSITSGFGAIDVGSSSIDGGTITGTFSGNITGNVTGNCSGTALTVTQAAQTAITSVGTLTSLAVGNITSTGNLALTAGLAAIGSSANAAVALNITSNDMAGTSQYGLNVNPTFTSDATAAGYGLRVLAGTDNASFTQTNTYGILIESGVEGSGSTITNLYGLKIEDQASGGTNYAIKTGTGAVSFGDTLSVTGTSTLAAINASGNITVASAAPLLIAEDTSAYSAGATTSQMLLQGFGSTAVKENLVAFTAQATASRYSNLVIETSNGSGGAQTALTLTGAATPAATFAGDLGVGTAPSNHLHVKETGVTGWLAKFESNYSASSDVSIEMCYSGSGDQNSGMNIAMDDDASNEYIFLCQSATVTRFKVAGDGAITMGSLPTSDPSVANQLWNDSGTVKISAG